MKKLALDKMRQELLSKEDRQKNLSGFLADSAVKHRVYHGTSSDVKQFTPSVRGALGHGIYFTDEPDVASHFADRAAVENRQANAGTNVIPVYINTQRMLDVDKAKPSEINAIIKAMPRSIDALEAVGYPRYDNNTRKLINDEIGKYANTLERTKKFDPHDLAKILYEEGSQAFINIMRNAGFDGLTRVSNNLSNRGPYREYTVFHPHQIKSATGNRGTYDPNDPDITKAEGGSVEDDYRSEHTAPSPDFGAPMHDVTRDMYPKDFYGPSGFRIYADYGEHKDRDAYNKVVRVRNKPNEMVYIHRAIPTKVYEEALKKDEPLKHMIRKGDWVAISKDYAKEHGQAVLQGDFKIASMRVPAKHVWTNADSIHEWGYHPVEEKAKGGSINMSEQVNHVPQKGVPSIGINVATDKDMRYADLIVDGKKRYESRNSDSLRPWVGKRVSIVRTGEGKAKAIGAATLGEPLVVDASKFRAMQEQHLVPPGSKFDIKAGVKYLYPVNDPERFDKEHDVGHGIVARRVTQTMADGGTPKKTVTAYKLFRVDPKHPGKLFPLFVNANKPVETGKWIDAEEGSRSKTGKVKSKLGDLAYRPGWHSGDVPIATHIGDKDEEQKAEAARIEELRKATAAKLGNDKKAKEAANKKHPYPDWVSAPRLRSPNHLWAEVSLPDDVNWQEEATKRGINKKGKVIAKNAHITDQIPKGGNYRYKTNPNMTGNWLISGSMKVNRVLPDEEVERINKEAGVKDLPRENPMDLKKFGFAQGGPTIDQMRYQLQKRKG